MGDICSSPTPAEINENFIAFFGVVSVSRLDLNRPAYYRPAHNLSDVMPPVVHISKVRSII